MKMLSTAAVALALAAPAFAQDAVTLQVGESDEYGSYLETADGAPVYLFTTDTQGSGDAGATVSCSGDCLQAWPPVTGEATAGEGVDQSLIGSTDADGQQVVTYNGWPLYTFVQDEGQDQPQGQDKEGFGGEWYLVTPAGEKVED